MTHTPLPPPLYYGSRTIDLLQPDEACVRGCGSSRVDHTLAPGAHQLGGWKIIGEEGFPLKGLGKDVPESLRWVKQPATSPADSAMTIHVRYYNPHTTTPTPGINIHVCSDPYPYLVVKDVLLAVRNVAYDIELNAPDIGASSARGHVDVGCASDWYWGGLAPRAQERDDRTWELIVEWHS